MTPVSKRDRWVALGVLLLGLALAYLLFVHPWWTVPMLAEGERIRALQERELRARTQLEQAPQIREALTRARAQQARNPGFLPESSAELASAGLIKRLETVVVQASPGNRSCEITNRSPQPGQAAERYARVLINVRLKCGMPETVAVLHALESGAPRLFVDNLNILSTNFFAGPDQGQRGNGGLEVNFDLYGYLRPQPGAKPVPARTQTGAVGAL